MTIRTFLTAIILGGCVGVSPDGALAQPTSKLCTASFGSPNALGSYASADLSDGGLERLYVEMGPMRSPLIIKGEGVSGAYTAQAPEVSLWRYMSIYQPVQEWLAPGGVRLDYSGFRIGWPEFRLAGKVVKKLKLTVTQGDQSMTVAVDPDDKGVTINSRVIAIDYEGMLIGDYPAVRVDDNRAWRKVEDAGRPIAITLTDASNGKVIARGETARIRSDKLQDLLSGGLNALRDKFRAGNCV